MCLILNVVKMKGLNKRYHIKWQILDNKLNIYYSTYFNNFVNIISNDF